MGKQVCHQYSHDEVVEALLGLVDEGLLEMGVDAVTGDCVWIRVDDRTEMEESEALAVG